jgi:hypothetical protein
MKKTLLSSQLINLTIRIIIKVNILYLSSKLKKKKKSIQFMSKNIFHPKDQSSSFSLLNLSDQLSRVCMNKNRTFNLTTKAFTKNLSIKFTRTRLKTPPKRFSEMKKAIEAFNKKPKVSISPKLHSTKQAITQHINFLNKKPLSIATTSKANTTCLSTKNLQDKMSLSPDMKSLKMY